MKKIMFVILALSLGRVLQAADDQEIASLKKQIAELNERVEKLERVIAPFAEKTLMEERIGKLQIKARDRMKNDSELYSQKQLREVEELYQVANKKWQSPEGKNSLLELVKKYDKANRTGCAMLYLGQMSDGEEKVEFLTKAISEFSDCWYGDGVQVGAYARFILADHFRHGKQPEKAQELLDELKRLFPDAIDHRGKLLAELTDQ